MQLLAPLVAKPDATPADETAYKQAYTDYYNQNDTLSRVGQTLKDVAGSGSKIGGALWDMVKSGVKTASNLPGAVIPSIPFVTQADPVGDLAAAGKGVLSGARSTYMLGQSLSEKAMEQINNAVADVAPLPEARAQAAQLAVDRLKLNQQSAGLNANPYNAQTNPQQAALFDTGNAGGAMLVPGVAPAAEAAAKSAQVAGDIIENGTYKMIGAGLKAMPPVVKTVEGAGAAYTAAQALSHGSISTALEGAAALGGKMSGAFTKGAAYQSGLFQATDKLADVMLTTPLGDSAIDSVVKYAPVAIDQAKQDLSLVRANTQQLYSDLADAKAAGESTIPLDKAIKKSLAQESLGNFKVNIMEKGASMAQTLQKWGMAGIPSKLADATAGAIQGGLLGGVVAASNAQPGDDSTIANGASKGAAYGGILSMLGTASQASQTNPGPSSFQQRSQQAIQQMQSTAYPSPIGPPTANSPWAQLQMANARLQGGKAGAGITNVRLKPQPSPLAQLAGNNTIVPEGAPPSALRQIATDQATNVFTDASGVPHNIDELANEIKQTAGGVVEAAKKEIPGQTFDYEIAPPRQVKGPTGSRSWAMPAGGPLSDQQMDWHAANVQPVSSKAFDSVSYNPDSQTLALHMTKKDGYQHYMLHEVTPQDFADFLAGKDAEGSMGKHFNSILRNEHPYYHIMDPHYVPAPIPEAPGAASP